VENAKQQKLVICNKASFSSKCVYVSTRSLQVKVVVCFLILGAGRAVNVLVPYMYKIIGK